ncbi:MAG TPA: MobH family relaxase [Cellvibrio sp.]|nr:MobH family relaxase [Cellvibrio sp.]
MSSQIPILSAQNLFKQLKIDPELPELRTVAGLDARVFDVLMKDVIHRFAELVQLAPASENHHHSGPGGLLVHTLDVATMAIKKRRGYKLPLGGSLEDFGQQLHLWTYAVFAGCVLHDIGKLSASIRLVAQLKNGQERPWTPANGPLTQIPDAKTYRIEFRKTPYRYHERLALTHWDLLPKYAREWIIEAPNIMQELTAWLWGDKYECGTIGEIIEYADRESTARNLQIPAEHRFSNSIPVIDRYLKLIRLWIEDGSIRINVSGGMGWVDNDGHVYLVCRSLAGKLIEECNSQGLKSLPQDPVRIYDILQEHGYAIPTEDGKAIWTIGIKSPTFFHQLTCLKFQLRKLLPPSRKIESFSGVIAFGEALKQLECEIKQDADAQQDTAKSIAPAAHGGGTETESTRQETAAAQEACTDNSLQPESDSAGDLQDDEYTQTEADTTSQQETPATRTAEIPQETAEETESNQGSIASNIALVKNLTADAPDLAQKFFSWLQKGLLEKTIVVNNPVAEVHIVEEGVFLLAPAIFKSFLRLHDIEEEKHKNLSKRFRSLRKNIRNGDVNIHSYWVTSSNRASKINGWLLPFNAIYENDFPIPKPNKYIKKTLGDNEMNQ